MNIRPRNSYPRLTVVRETPMLRWGIFMLEHETSNGAARPGEDRRDPGQSRERKSGVVVAVNGSRATVAARMADLISDAEQFWSVGELVSIYAKNSRVVCLVQEMVAELVAIKPARAPDRGLQRAPLVILQPS